MRTINMSRRWRGRLDRGTALARRTGRAVVVMGAAVGLAAGVRVFVVAPHPDAADIAVIATRVDNQRSAAGQFAADFVTAVLTVPAGRRADLHRYLTVPPAGSTAPGVAASDPAPAVVDRAGVWSVSPAGTGADGQVDLYAAVVVVQQRPYLSAPPTRAFYRVAVAVWRYQPRALQWPVPISDPGPGADVPAGYDRPLDPSSPVYAVVAGFVTNYLTGASGLDRYVVADSWITAVGGYRSATVTAADTDADIPDSPPPGARVRVRATVTAQTPQFAAVPFTFPLTVENSNGTWMVADIDPIPRLGTDADATPVGKQRSSS